MTPPHRNQKAPDFKKEGTSSETILDNPRMSAQTAPISSLAFQTAIHDLPLSTLRLKIAEIQNSIAHLDYSNEQLRPFAEGTSEGATEPDQDCIDAIRENELVVKRMMERTEMLRLEIAGRGGSHGAFDEEPTTTGTGTGTSVGEQVQAERSNPWTDGTFTTGRVVDGEMVMDTLGEGINGTAPATRPAAGVNGIEAEGVADATSTTMGARQGGRLDDDALRRAMEEQMRLQDEDDDEGMHL